MCYWFSVFVILTVICSITQRTFCGIISDPDRIDRDKSQAQQEDEEMASEMEKLKEKLLDRLGLDTVPTDVISKDDIPEPLLRNLISYQDERLDLETDSAMDAEKDLIHKKKIMVVGNIGKMIFHLSIICFVFNFPGQILADQLFLVRNSYYLDLYVFSLYHKRSVCRARG